MKSRTLFANEKRRVTGTLWLVAWLALGAFFLWKGIHPNESQPTSPDPNPASLSENSSPLTKPIEQIQVGERVATGISNELRELADEEIGALPDWDSKPIDPDSWRKVELTLTRDDGSAMDIVLLRPADWITESGIDAGREVFLAIPEMRQQGLAYIEAIDECPDIKEGNGRVVTGTFASTVDEVVAVHIDGLAEPIRSTPEHPFYRVNDRQFVPASELRNGDRVQHVGGLAKIERVLPGYGTFRVHNLEVHGDHVFRVSTAGVLVHNTWVDPKTVRWSQNNARNWSDDGYSVIRNAINLKHKNLDPNKIRIRVWKDPSSGKIWTLDNRRFTAFRMAEMKRIPVRFVSDKVARRELFGVRPKMTTVTDGLSIRLKLGGGQSIPINW